MTGELSLGDPVAVAGLAAAAGGAFAVIDPYFRGLSEAASALAVIAWLPRTRGVRSLRADRSRRVVGALAGVIAGAAAFLTLPTPLDRFGALALGASALALGWWVPASPDPEAR
jgi:hypothetical protein